MGISTEVYTIYGWEVEITDKVSVWVKGIDYDFPSGILAYGMDFTKLMVGPVLFYSGDARWGVLEGFESFSEGDAELTMNKWQHNNKEVYTKLQVICPELKYSPKFYTFVNYS